MDCEFLELGTGLCWFRLFKTYYCLFFEWCITWHSDREACRQWKWPSSRTRSSCFHLNECILRIFFFGLVSVCESPATTRRQESEDWGGKKAQENAETERTDNCQTHLLFDCCSSSSSIIVEFETSSNHKKALIKVGPSFVVNTFDTIRIHIFIPVIGKVSF